jgi:hypothetical protein
MTLSMAMMLLGCHLVLLKGWAFRRLAAWRVHSVATKLIG